MITHLDAAKLAQAAYLPWDECREAVAKLGFYNRFQAYDLDGAQAYLAASEHTCVYSFAGTNEWIDLLRNLSFWKSGTRHIAGVVGMEHAGVYDETSRLRFHNGFKRALPGTLAVEMHRQMREWWMPGMKIIGSHHSLGCGPGSLFGLTAVASMGVSRESHCSHLWGCPRMGNHIFRDHYNRSIPLTLRHLHCNDIVGRIPPWLFGYRHVGLCVYYDAFGRRYTNPRVCRRAWNQLTGRAKSIYTDRNFVSGVTDHFMESYVDILEKRKPSRACCGDVLNSEG